MKYYLTIFFSPALIFLLYDIFFYWLWVPFGEYSNDVIYFLSFFSIVNLCLIFWIIYSLNKKRISKIYADTSNRKGIGVSFILILIFFGLFALYMQLGGELTLDLETRYSQVNASGIFWIVIMQIIAYILIFDLYISRKKPYVFFLVFLFILSSALTGGRSGAIWWSLLIFFIATTKFNLGWKHLASAIILVFTFFVSASIMRGTISFNGSGDLIGYLDFNQIFTFEETMQYTQIHGAQFSRFLGDVIDGFVPRSINPNKNTSTAFTREVFPNVWERTSYTSGFYANLLFVFGNFGLFIAPLFMISLNALYLRAISGESKINFIILYFCLLPLLIVRGGIFEFRVVMALFLISFAIFLHYFFNKKIVLIKMKKEIK